MCVSNHPFHPSFSVHTNRMAITKILFPIIISIAWFPSFLMPCHVLKVQMLLKSLNILIPVLSTNNAQPHYQRQVGNKKRISRISGAAIHLQAIKRSVLPPQATISPHLYCVSCQSIIHVHNIWCVKELGVGHLKRLAGENSSNKFSSNVSS